MNMRRVTAVVETKWICVMYPLQWLKQRDMRRAHSACSSLTYTLSSLDPFCKTLFKIIIKLNLPTLTVFIICCDRTEKGLTTILRYYHLNTTDKWKANVKSNQETRKIRTTWRTIIFSTVYFFCLLLIVYLYMKSFNERHPNPNPTVTIVGASSSKMKTSMRWK